MLAPGPICRRTSKAEFDACLECGILAHGFLRLRCGDCGHDKLVAFSCKRRGFCPSCGARRMAQAAAHLVDHVIPHVPVRQWVLIWVMRLPIPLRLLLAAQPKLATPVLQVVQRVITRFLLEQAGAKADEADSGAVTLIQPNFHDRVGRQPEHPPALPGAGRRVPARRRRWASVRRGTGAER